MQDLTNTLMALAIALLLLSIPLEFVVAVVMSIFAKIQGKEAKGMSPVGRAALFVWFIFMLEVLMFIGVTVANGGLNETISFCWTYAMWWLKQHRPSMGGSTSLLMIRWCKVAVAAYVPGVAAAIPFFL